MKSNYVPFPEVRKATPDELWLRQQIDRIDPWHDEMGNDMGYTKALQKLVFELRDKLRAMGADA